MEEFLMIILGYFPQFFHKCVYCGYSLEVVSKALLMSTHNICFMVKY